MIFKGGVGAVLSPSHLKKPVTLFCVRRYHTKGILRKIKSCKTALMIWLSKIIPFLRHWALFPHPPIRKMQPGGQRYYTTTSIESIHRFMFIY